jgi:hypothetical protein
MVRIENLVENKKYILQLADSTKVEVVYLGKVELNYILQDNRANRTYTFNDIGQDDLQVDEIPLDPTGVKHDSGKLDWSLMPLTALEPVVAVLMEGARKYARNNWMNLMEKPGGRMRAVNAIERHLTKYKEITGVDPEWKLSHMSHLACNAIFLLWAELPKETRDAMRKRIAELEEGL